LGTRARSLMLLLPVARWGWPMVPLLLLWTLGTPRWGVAHTSRTLPSQFFLVGAHFGEVLNKCGWFISHSMAVKAATEYGRSSYMKIGKAKKGCFFNTHTHTGNVVLGGL